MATSSALALENGRSALKVHGSALLALTYQGIGIVYADLGTSPLYTLNGLWPPDEPVPSKADVIGGVSAVLWAILFLPLMKYILICLEFGTREGEGGPFALFQGLFPRQNPDGESGVRLHREARSSKPTPKLNPSFKHPLLVWTLLGTSLTLADGVLTPAVSVTAAVSGIAAAKPSVSDHLVPISIGFLLALFLAQPMGTARLASVFSPTIIVWFALIAAIGVANIITYPGILRAFDPSRAVLFFVRTGRYDVLSGVLLALGGCEAIFANLGQFNALSIRISFTTVVLPSILLSYLGQGARLIRDKGNVLDDIFYQTIPGPSNGLLFWLTYVMAILATLIASQALVTATFSLVQQLVNMESLPPMEIRYTSNTTQGQVYIPVANWILMIACIACVAGFKGNEALTNAYGFAVATVMFTTTVLVALQMYYVKGLSVFIALAFLVVFGFLDGLLWGATVRKVPHGAWFPLTAGVVLMLFMLFWTWAKGLEVAFDDGNRRDLWSFITSSSDMEEKETDTYSDRQTISSQSYLSGIELQQTNRLKRTPTGMETCYYVREDVDPDLPPTAKTKVLTRIDTCAIFHKLSAGRGVPPSFVGFIDHWPALPRVIIFLSAEVASVPKVEPEDQYYLRKIHPSQCFYSVTYRRGYRESYGAKFEDIIDRVCQLEFSIEGRRDRRQVEALIQDIRRSAETCTHVAPYYNILSKQLENTTLIGRILNWCRRILLEKVYRRISALSNQASDERSDPSRLFYVGVNASI